MLKESAFCSKHTACQLSPLNQLEVQAFKQKIHLLLSLGIALKFRETDLG
jgi:hypothetical protein